MELSLGCEAQPDTGTQDVSTGVWGSTARERQREEKEGRREEKRESWPWRILEEFKGGRAGLCSFIQGWG